MCFKKLFDQMILPSLCAFPDLSALDKIRSYDQDTPEEEIILDRLRRRFICNPRTLCLQDWIKESLADLLTLAPLWPSERVKSWLHGRNII
jgi:hypothetical protein